jgi:hypothetical protein
MGGTAWIKKRVDTRKGVGCFSFRLSLRALGLVTCNRFFSAQLDIDRSSHFHVNLDVLYEHNIQ